MIEALEKREASPANVGQIQQQIVMRILLTKCIGNSMFDFAPQSIPFVPTSRKIQPPFFASILDRFRTPIFAPKGTKNGTKNYTNSLKSHTETCSFRSSFSCLVHTIGCHCSIIFVCFFRANLRNDQYANIQNML